MNALSRLSQPAYKLGLSILIFPILILACKSVTLVSTTQPPTPVLTATQPPTPISTATQTPVPVFTEKPSQIYDANGITFNYPQNWDVISPDQLSVQVTDYTYLAVLADKDDSTGTVVRIVIVQTDKGFNDYLAGERTYFKEQYKDQLSEKAISANGMPATQFETIGNTLSGEKKKSLNIYFEQNNKIYYLTFSTLLANYDKVKPDFDMIVKSFQIK